MRDSMLRDAQRELLDDIKDVMETPYHFYGPAWSTGHGQELYNVARIDRLEKSLTKLVKILLEQDGTEE